MGQEAIRGEKAPRKAIKPPDRVDPTPSAYAGGFPFVGKVIGGGGSVRFEVPADAKGFRLSRFLFDRLKLSRNLVRRAKGAGGLLVDGVQRPVSHRLEGGEWVELQLETEGRVLPEALPLNVVYEDDQVLVVDKPAGMVVHPVRNYVSGTLANAVAHHLRGIGGPGVARPVLRIDRETSGLVLFARTPLAAQRLSQQLSDFKLDRSYLGLVRGWPEAEQGCVDLPIRRVWGHPVAREVAAGPRTPEQEAELREAEGAGRVLRGEWRSDGQRALTHYRVQERFQGASLLKFWLETGRTHQIRVHLSHLGHPLLGDGLYGEGGDPGRQALHAATLRFAHPLTGQIIHCDSPLPPDLIRFIGRLRGEPDQMQ